MNEDPKNEEIVIADHSSIEVQEIHNEIDDQTIIVANQEKVDVEKEEVCDDTECHLKSAALQQISEENVQVSASMDSFSMSSMVESELSSSTLCPMEQSTSSLPRLAMAPTADGCHSPMDTGCDEINQAWFTTKEDKDSLQGKGVKWRQGMWSKEESETLQNNIMQYCKNRGISDPREVVFKQSKEERKTFYRSIAKGIHRPLFAIYRRVLRTYETGNYNGKYTPEEVSKLKELRKKHGNDWTAIGLALGRSASSVKDRCRLLNEKCSSGKWSQDEEDRLSRAVHEMTSTAPGESVTSGILWTDVAKRVGTRSEKQCRSKWLNYLNWKECGGKEWNKTDEIELIKKIYNLGVENESDIDWSALADGWASARSPQWLRSKWWTIKKHVTPNLSFPETIADLHSHYARSLKHRLNRHDTRYLQLPTTEQPLTLTTGAPLSPLTTCATVSTSVGHAITVDGEIYIARGDGKGSDGVNTYEMVHLRPLPSTDPSQPTSYIIEPVQCTTTGSATSYILHQTPQEQGAKAVKAFSTSSSSLRQETESHEESQQNNTRNSIINTVQPATVSTLRASGVAMVLDTESITKHVDDHEEVISRPNTRRLSEEETHTYVEKGATDILQQDQQLECVSEEEISTTVHEEGEATRELQNAAEQNDRSHEHSHDTLAYHGRSPDETPSPTATQSLDMSFSTTDNTIYSHSVVPSLVSNTRPARIIANEVIIPQPTLPEHILQTQADEPAFLVASGPLEIVHDTLAEVTVPSSVSGISSENLIIENEMTYFK